MYICCRYSSQNHARCLWYRQSISISAYQNILVIRQQYPRAEAELLLLYQDQSVHTLIAAVGHRYIPKFCGAACNLNPDSNLETPNPLLEYIIPTTLHTSSSDSSHTSAMSQPNDLGSFHQRWSCCCSNGTSPVHT